MGHLFLPHHLTMQLWILKCLEFYVHLFLTIFIIFWLTPSDAPYFWQNLSLYLLCIQTMTMLICYFQFVLSTKFLMLIFIVHFFDFIFLCNNTNSIIKNDVQCKCVFGVWTINKICQDTFTPFHISWRCKQE